MHRKSNKETIIEVGEFQQTTAVKGASLCKQLGGLDKLINQAHKTTKQPLKTCTDSPFSPTQYLTHFLPTHPSLYIYGMAT